MFYRKMDVSLLKIYNPKMRATTLVSLKNPVLIHLHYNM